MSAYSRKKCVKYVWCDALKIWFYIIALKRLQQNIIEQKHLVWIFTTVVWNCLKALQIWHTHEKIHHIHHINKQKTFLAWSETGQYVIIMVERDEIYQQCLLRS